MERRQLSWQRGTSIRQHTPYFDFFAPQVPHKVVKGLPPEGDIFISYLLLFFATLAVLH
jgi:hypothetical protein